VRLKHTLWFVAVETGGKWETSELPDSRAVCERRVKLLKAGGYTAKVVKYKLEEMK
jgi:hypothetical protein